MDVDAIKKKLLIGGVVAIAGVAFYMQRQKQAPVEAVVGGPRGSTANATFHQQELDKALDDSLVAIKGGKLREAALGLYYLYPGFESFSNEHGFKATAEGPTLREWFDGRRERYMGELKAAWPAIRAGLRTGDIAWDEYRSFDQNLPFIFTVDIKQSFRADQREIETARTAAAPGWYLVQLVLTTGDDHDYETAVREALSRTWSSPPGLKLVFDRPMTPVEADAAARFLQVEIAEEFSDYEFSGQEKRRGSGRVPHAVTVKFTPEARQGAKPIIAPPA